MSDVLLIPMPRSVRSTGEQATVPPDAAAWALGALTMLATPQWITQRATGGWCGADPREAQGYRLSISRHPNGGMRVATESPTAAGLRHARAAIVQLLRQFPDTMPTLEIDDRPAFARRGVMLDVSRCRIPTMPEFRRIIDQLASLRCNHLQLYTEHTFAYAGHEEIWRDWDPITPDEIASLDAYCRARGIDLAANQNCFGHLRAWLEHPAYAYLAETHGDWLFDVWPRNGPFSLCPTDPRSLDFVEDLLGQLLPCFSSDLVNIGCDETYDIAYGRSASEVRALGRGTVFAQFVARIAEVARRHCKRSMFWADIALSQPECMRLLPADTIPLAWGYEPDTPWEDWCNALHAHGSISPQGSFWLCPGTSSWRSFTGRTSERRLNIQGAAKSGVAHGAAGLLICDWGDSGHWQTWPIALHGLTDGLANAWAGPTSPDPAARASALRAESLHLFGDPTGHVASWLDELGDADLALRRECMPLSRPGVAGQLRNQSAVFADLFRPWLASRDVGSLHRWVEVFESLTRLSDSRPGTGDDLVDAELELAAAMAVQAAGRARVRRMEAHDAGARASQAHAWRALEEEHRRLWTKRSRPGGLEQSCAFFRKIDLGG
ncbi:Beta-hexosaminidase [Phycisphaerales bacterium]|nr:Beta-hexosaminidase [Phycisphaerales bacterium]